MQRRELGWGDENVFLPDELAAGRRRPGAGFAGLVAQAEAVGGVRVGPDVDPLVERAELGMPAEGERRVFQPALDPLGPFLDDRRGGARQHRVGADLVKVAELARLQLRRERRRDDDLALHLLDEFLDLRRPARDLFGADLGAVRQILIGPAMDDPVERPDFGMEEGAERRDPDAFLEPLAKALLGLRDRPGLQAISAHLDDHGIAPWKGDRPILASETGSGKTLLSAPVRGGA